MPALRSARHESFVPSGAPTMAHAWPPTSQGTTTAGIPEAAGTTTRRRIHQQRRQTASTPPELAPQTPASATAQCGDGPYSYSQSRRGTCSSHGGAPAWLEHSSFDSRHMTATELSYQEDKTHEQRAAAFTFRDCTRSRVLGERIS
ncbi:DUF3761 domain-containing protein [Rhodococcus sp. MS16]|nr:DUF3761 domain-containing protein [Rhodococcus sp. MS16]